MRRLQARCGRSEPSASKTSRDMDCSFLGTIFGPRHPHKVCSTEHFRAERAVSGRHPTSLWLAARCSRHHHAIVTFMLPDEMLNIVQSPYAIFEPDCQDTNRRGRRSDAHVANRMLESSIAMLGRPLPRVLSGPRKRLDTDCRPIDPSYNPQGLAIRRNARERSTLGSIAVSPSQSSFVPLAYDLTSRR